MANNNQTANVTFVQADPSNFRAVVQRLTGAPSAASAAPTFNLHERRHIAKKLKLHLTGSESGPGLASPVSPLDIFTRGSPRTPPPAVLSPVEEEEMAIARKGYYLHPSPRNVPRRHEPELLPLFPVHSPLFEPAVSSA